jgi:hypothetical protein
MVASDAFCTVSFRTYIKTFITSLTAAFALCEFYSKMSNCIASVIDIAAVLLLCYCM